jgi:hypothetical protein
MSDFIAGGSVVGLILALVAAEAVVLVVALRRSGRPVSGILANLAAGACLLLAVRAALTGAGWTTVAVWLALSLPAHAIDIWRRFRD